MILCVETTTAVCSVGIVDPQNPARFAYRESTENDHAAVVTLLITACLRDLGCTLNALQAVAVSNGPGSYTSLRVGTSTAKGLCYALNIPMIAVETLASLASAAAKKLPFEPDVAASDTLICPMIDARRMEVYCQLFTLHLPNASVEPTNELSAQIIDNQSFVQEIDTVKNFVFCGNGAEKCRYLFQDSPSVFFSEIEACSAVFMFEGAVSAFAQKQFVDIAYHTPQYFKAPNITISKKNVLV